MLLRLMGNPVAEHDVPRQAIPLFKSRPAKAHGLTGDGAAT